MMRSGIVATWLAGIAAICALSVAPLCEGAEVAAQGAAPNKPSISYRRVFVPAERVDVWPRGEGKFLPLEAKEFERLVGVSLPQNSGDESAAHLLRATYYAQFVGGELQECRGEWECELTGDEAARIELGAASISPKGAHWASSPRSRVQVGLWGASEDAGVVAALRVPRSDTLRFSWNARCRKTEEGYAFAMQLPPAGIVRLILDLAPGINPVAEQGVVLESSPQGPSVRWTIALASAANTTVRLVEQKRADPISSPADIVAERAIYFVGIRGIEVEVEHTLSEAPGPVVVVPLVAGLRLLSADCDGEALAWEISQLDSLGPAALIRLPDGPPQASAKLVLRGWQPVEMNVAKALPPLRPAGPFWSSGTAKLKLAPELEMRSLNVNEGRRTALIPQSRSSTGMEEWEFQLFSPAGRIEMEVGLQRSVASGIVASTLELNESGASGQTLAEMRLDQGEVKTFSADIGDAWHVEAVETEPAAALDSWFIVDGDEGGRRLDVRLVRTLQAEDEVSIVVRGQLQRGNPLEPLDLSTLRILDWRNVDVRVSLLRIDASASYVLNPTASLPAANYVELESPAQLLYQELVEGQGNITIFDLAGAEGGALVHVSSERPRFDADVAVDVECLEQELKNHYQVTCRPRESAIDQVFIGATEPLPGNVDWKVRGTDDRLAARRLSAEELRANRFPEGLEIWQLRLLRPTVEPVTIEGQTFSPHATRASVPLITVLDANTQTGSVLVRSRPDQRPYVDAKWLTAIPTPVGHEAADTGPGSAVRAAYDLKLTGREPVDQQPRLRITLQNEKESTRQTKVRQVVIESRYSGHGVSSHRAHYRIASMGQEFELRLPADATLERALLEERELAIDPAHSADWLRIPLPRGEEVDLVLEFTQRTAPLSNGSRLSVPLPTANDSIQAGEWYVSIPAEFHFEKTSEFGGSVLSGPWRSTLSFAEELVAKPLRRLIGSTDADLDESATTTKTPTTVSEANEPSSDGLDGPVVSIEGWRTYRTSFIVDGPEPLSVIRPASYRVWSLSAVLIALFVGLRLRHQRALFISLLAASALLALWLPTAQGAVAGGACLGLLLSLFVPRRETVPAEMTSTLTYQHSGVFSTVLVCLVASGTLNGAEPASGEASAAATADAAPPSILIPIDESGAVQGSKYYVNEDLLTELLRNERRTSFRNNWLIRDLTVTGAINSRGAGGTFTAGAWLIAVELEVLARDTQVVVPWPVKSRGTAHSLHLDGVRIEPLGNDAEACAFQVDEPGIFEANLAFIPEIVREGGVSRVELDVPRIHGARLNLALPPELKSLDIDGATRVEGSSGQFAAVLDGSGTVVVRWTTPGEPGQDTSTAQVTELRWMRIEPTGITLEARYSVDDTGAGLGFVSILVDRAWQVTSPAEEIAPDNADDRMRIVRASLVDVAIGATRRREATVRFSLSPEAVVGQLKLPPMELITPVSGVYRLGVSATDEFECQILGTGAWAPGEIEDFVSAWGAGGTDRPTPRLILAEVSPPADLTVAIRPRTMESEIVEVVHLGASSDGLHFQYQADVDPNELNSFQYSLDISSEVEIEDVLLSRGGGTADVRWVRAAPERINLFFSEPLADSYRLVVLGRVAARADGKYSIPTLTANPNEAAAREYHLYRADDVLVASPVEGATEAATEAAVPPVPWDFLWTRKLELEGKAAQQNSVAVTPNVVELDGDTLLAMSREASAWVVSYSCHARVDGGELAALQFRAPAPWFATAQWESEPKFNVTTGPAENGQMMITARAARPISLGESIRLTARATVSPLEVTGLKVPNVTIETPGNWRTFLSIPSEVDGQNVAWTRSGVTPADLPESIAAGRDGRGLPQTYRVDSDSFDVTLDRNASGASASAARDSAAIRLADTRVIVDESGQIAQTRFVVAPRGLPTCLIRMAEGEELVDAKLDGQQAMLMPAGSGLWAVRLGYPLLPQLLELTTRKETQGGLTRPTLLNGDVRIPVELSLWTIAHPKERVIHGEVLTQPTSAFELTALRNDRLASIVEAALPTAVALSASRGFDWFFPWSRELLAVSDEGGNLLASETGSAISQVSSSAIDQLRVADARIDGIVAQGQTLWPEVLPERWGAGIGAEGGRTAFLSSARPDFETVYLIEAGGGDTLPLWLGEVASGHFGNRLLATLAILAACAAVIGIPRQSAWPDVFLRWPHVLGVLTGFACWAWLTPSWLGLAIVALSAVLALRTCWEGRVLRR